MRIRTIRLENLNSLHGIWEIDLTHPAYLADGIFVLSGSTGAGKSTVLDAVCLALYGQTPRLDNIGTGANEIMSRQTGHCSAEVTFETPTGRYRAHWSQKRARGKPDGRLQSPRREVTDATTKDLLADRITEATKCIEELTGLSYDQFTRAMLLAQGGFSAFLDAKPADRSALLEKMTGTDIYSQISQTVQKRYGAEKSELDSLKTQLGGLACLSAGDEATCREAIVTLRQALEDLDERIRTETAACQWLETLNKLEVERLSLIRNRTDLDERVADFAPRQRDLEAAERAARALGEETRKTTLEKTDRDDREALARAIARRVDVGDALGKAETARNKATKTLEDQKRAWNDAQPTLKVVRALDVALAERATLEAAATADLERAKGDLKSARDRQDKDEEDARAAREESDRLARDLGQDQRQFQADLDDLDERIKALEDRQSGLEAERLTATETLQDLERKAGLLKRIAVLSHEARALEHGQPCLLCGATEHPNPYVPRDGEVEETEAEITEKRTALGDLEAEERGNIKMLGDLKTSRATVKAFLETLQNLQTNLPFDVGGPSTADLLQVPVDPSRRWEACRVRIKGKNTCDEDLSKLSTRIETRIPQIAAHEKAVSDGQDRLRKASDGLDDLRKKRHDLFGHKDPDGEEQRLKGLLETAQKDFDAGEDAFQKAQTTQSTLETGIRDRQAQIDDRLADLQAAQQAFTVRLRALGFCDEATYLAAKRSEDERASLTGQAQALRDEEKALNTTSGETEKQLEIENARALTDQSLEDLRDSLGQLGEKKDSLQQNIGAQDQKLRDNEAAKIRSRDLGTRIADQQSRVDRWAALHDLIGSHDGKKFRDYAQGLTFQHLIALANGSLEHLTGRYVLICDRDCPLHISVMDAQQGGVTRSVSNLSGGETFIVSLALALGLSKMASRKVPVDSLFLDEGFGTLDNDALDMVLTALARLPQDGKLIGVISHVEALKDRIGTHIQALPTGAGRSRLIGPGVTRVGVSGSG